MFLACISLNSDSLLKLGRHKIVEPNITKDEVYELCKENPEKWETVAKDCLANMAFDDIEDAYRRNG